MMHDFSSENRRLLRLGVFYDGNYFAHVSNYYAYEHARRARIGISGLHRFIVHEISRLEGADPNRCRIVDAHYFRGRLGAAQALERNILYRERQFDEVLMRAGVVAHYLPVVGGGEKGIDVWLALEALELAMHKRFDVVVLVAGDGDYLPLVRKLNTIGTRVAILGWDFEYIDNQGRKRLTKTAQSLLDEANYPIIMSQIIDDRSRRTDPLINDLFLPATIQRREVAPLEQNMGQGIVSALKKGYGFIKDGRDGATLFFHYNSLEDIDFNDLREGDPVCYERGENEQGACAERIRLCQEAKAR